MENIIFVRRLSLVLTFAAALITGSLNAQQIDDPNLDQVPKWLLDTYQQRLSDFDIITTPDGYDNFDIGVAFAEPHISMNPLNPLQIFSAFNTNTAYRTINGHDWTASTPSFGVSVNGDPVTAYDSLGNLYYESMFGGITGCKVIRSTNNGQTWSAAVTAISGNDKNWIACDQTSGPYANYVYTTMTNSGSGNFARSTNFGASFTNTATFATQSLPGMMVAVGPNVIGGDVPGGCVYVVTNSGSSVASTYTFYVSTNGGLSFTLKSAQNFANYVGTYVGGRNSVENMRTRPYPFITADNSYGPYRGRLYLVYASNTPSGDGNKPDIFCRYSTNQGTTWSAAIKINDDLNSQNHHQWHPAVWCDKETGRLYTKWMDTRDTPTSDSAYIYASYSTNGGVNWVTNQRISNRKMKIDCATCGGGGTPRYQGDYDAITSKGNVSIAVWTDFRNGQFGSYVGYFPDFAMLMSNSADTLYQNNDTTFFSVNVPSVTLYSDAANFTAQVSPTPPSGSISVTPVGSGSISTFPNSVQFKVVTTGFVTPGIYTITFTGAGPQGIPVHKRSVTLLVTNIAPASLSLLSPDGGENWVIGSIQNITWSSTSVNNVRLEYTTNNGSSWNNIINSTPAAAGSYSWTIPNTPSALCKVRVSNTIDPGLNDVSSNIFSINQPIVSTITVTSPNGGENLLAGSYHSVTWTWEAVDFVKIEYTTNLGTSWIPIINSHPNSGVYVWSVPNTVSNNCRIKVSDANNLLIFDESNSSFTIYLMQFNVNPGWNLVSVPILTANMNTSVLFPTASSGAYGYDNGYIAFDSLKNGFGYWLKFDSSETISLQGIQIGSIVISVFSGWNLIGPFASDVVVSGITSTPVNIVVSPFYGFAGGYISANTLQKGKGYWVRTNQNGLLHLNVTGFR